MKIAILAITKEAERLGEKLSEKLPDSTLFRCRGQTAKALRQAWERFDALVCIMACGIVVRAIAPLVQDKKSDPAVVVMDQQGRYCVPILSGHLGGANGLARAVAAITQAEAVITTGSDVTGHTPLDIWIGEKGMKIANHGALPRIMGRLLDSGSLKVFSDSGLPTLPDDLEKVHSVKEADVVITVKIGQIEPAGDNLALILHPPLLAAGIGCNRGTGMIKIKEALWQTCQGAGLSPLSVCRIATIDLKRDEKGLIELAKDLGLGISFFSADELNRVEETVYSDAAFRATGARGVCEPAAILAAGRGPLLVKKQKWKDVTIAIARVSWPWWAQAQGQ